MNEMRVYRAEDGSIVVEAAYGYHWRFENRESFDRFVNEVNDMGFSDKKRNFT